MAPVLKGHGFRPEELCFSQNYPLGVKARVFPFAFIGTAEQLAEKCGKMPKLEKIVP